MSNLNGIHGEIVAWDFVSNTKVTATRLRDALTTAGLDPKVARDMAPRNAFARACKELADRRVIRRVDESATELRFQFTSEVKDGDRLRYDFEAILTLDKRTGDVTCPDRPELAAMAAATVRAESDMRDVADISRVVQAVFNRAADLFPVRAQGGCYFVPKAFADFLTKVETFIAAVGGSLKRFPVVSGTRGGDRSVREAVEDGLAATIGEYRRHIAEFDDSTRESTVEKMVERLGAVRFKAEAYAEYLGEQRDAVLVQLADARQQLRKKISELGGTTDVPEPAGDGPAPAIEVAGPRAALDDIFGAAFADAGLEAA